MGHLRRNIFSKKALDNLNHIRSTDVLTNVTCPWMWILPAGLTLALAAITVWGFFGTLADNAAGLGLLVREGGVRAVVARSEGMVEHFNLDVGDRVAAGEIVGLIHNPEAFFNWRKLELRPVKDDAAREELHLARQLYEDGAWLRSDVSGVVTDLLRRNGDRVAAGEKVALLSAGNEEGGLHLVAFIPLHTGKRVRPGMNAFFSPATTRAQEHGYIRGVVRRANPYPVTAESIRAELKNDDFVRILDRQGSLIRLEIELLPDRATRSKLQWTSRSGADIAVDAGSRGVVVVNTEYRRPVSYLIPFLRERIFGIGRTDEETP